MPRSILSSSSPLATVAKRYTIRLPQTHWDSLEKVKAHAKAHGMSIDIDAVFADFLKREITKAERLLKEQGQNPQHGASSSSTDEAL
ncbi:hypothetical protein [Algiphilus sp.]|uniref:hypothetical protein n=1 Tax=Algiphilus sp. TaxID=1872431 RepID=UPI0032EF14D3